ncbi:MAG TPA: hypothetical protein VFA89_19235 [Terriglobales bacterium]|nr:hypothetical protein [Terriglobales bacterium]
MSLIIDPEFHRAFKAAVAMRGEEITEVLLHFIRSYVEKYAPKGLKPKSKGGCVRPASGLPGWRDGLAVSRARVLCLFIRRTLGSNCRMPWRSLKAETQGVGGLLGLHRGMLDVFNVPLVCQVPTKNGRFSPPYSPWATRRFSISLRFAGLPPNDLSRYADA